MIYLKGDAVPQGVIEAEVFSRRRRSLGWGTRHETEFFVR